MGLEQMLLDSAMKYPEKEAIVCYEDRISYRDLLNNVLVEASLLKEIMDGDQNRIMFCAHNSIHLIEMMLACWFSGNVACPVNWRLSCNELSKVMEEGCFDYCFTDFRNNEAIQHAVNKRNISIIVKDLDIFSAEARKKEYHDVSIGYKYSGVISDEYYAIQYFSSGTTGKPKGIIHTHLSMMKYANQYADSSDWTEDVVYETMANLFHLSGFSCMISLFRGGTLVLLDRFKEDEFFGAIEREHCSRVSMVPTIVSRVLNSGVYREYDISSVKKIVYGGSNIPTVDVDKAIRVFSCELEQAYGTTETCNITVLTPDDHMAAISGKLPPEVLYSVGRPTPGVELQIKGTNGEEVGEKEIGEICVKSPFLFSKYTNVDEEVRDEEGYYHTGDMGYRDPMGYVYVVNRKDDMIISGGENIYPSEVEKCISKMTDDVQEVIVVGTKDPIWGQSVTAYVVKKEGSSVTEEQVIEFCKRRIASYKKPKRVIFLEEMPVNSNGKIDRKKLAKL